MQRVGKSASRQASGFRLHFPACRGPDGPLCNLNLELAERIELSTSPLPRECSTTELCQPYRGSLVSRRARMLASTTLNAKRPRNKIGNQRTSI